MPGDPAKFDVGLRPFGPSSGIWAALRAGCSSWARDVRSGSPLMEHHSFDPRADLRSAGDVSTFSRCDSARSDSLVAPRREVLQSHSDTRQSGSSGANADGCPWHGRLRSPQWSDLGPFESSRMLYGTFMGYAWRTFEARTKRKTGYERHSKCSLENYD